MRREPTWVVGSEPDDRVASVGDVDSVLHNGVVESTLNAALVVQRNHLSPGCFAVKGKLRHE